MNVTAKNISVIWKPPCCEVFRAETAVVSCGGGVPLRRENVTEMKKIGEVILLTATPETIYSRTRGSDDRPNLKNRKSPEAIAELLEQRRPKYEAAADRIIATDHRTIDSICEELSRLVLN